MVRHLFVIFYLCVVMFLNLGHQLAKGETCVMVVTGMCVMEVVRLTIL